MTGGQRTFELIPTSLVKSNGQRRPMTSKAAKKAYQQANRGPKVSRAEQHRRDNAELEQQKREYEKERAAARAKAAREKKAAKANEEREARRKQGLPEPSKFVHASQPTISRFVRSNSTSKRTWQQMESVAEDSDKTISDTEKDDEGPPAKRRPPDESSDNEFGEFPSLSQSDLLEQIDSSILSAKDGKPASGSLAKAHPPLQTCRREASPELPPMKESDADATLTSQALDELVTTQLLSDLVEAVAKSDSIEPPNRHASQSQAETTLAPKPQPSPRRSGRVAEKFEKAATVLNATKPVTVPIAEIPKRVIDTTKPYDVIVNSLRNDGFKTPAPKPILQGRSVNMPSPRLPTRVSRAAVSIHTPQKPSDLSRHARYSASKPFSNIPPSSTQAFLENHLEDFFPSPTQAVRELLDDVDDLPSNTQVARDLSPEKAEKFKFEDFFGTQDLILSPQDWEEICSPSRAPPTPSQKANSEDSSSRAIVPPHPTSQRKGRFFQEKEEDLYHAAIQESKATSTQVTTKVQADISASFGRNQSDSTDYGDFDFNLPGLFKQKEDEDLEAAIHESKITAELEAKRLALVGTLGITRIQSNSTAYGDFDLPRLFEENEEEIHKSKTGSKAQAPQHAEDLTTNNGKGKPRRFFEEKYEDQLHAATHESKMLAAKKVPLKEGSEKPERTLKRVLSTATDYGDDDFTGCSQELLNLC